MQISKQSTSLAQVQGAKRRGFTLVELIVVIAIISTLLAVSVGTIKNVAGSQGVNTGVSLADGMFTYARNVAKANGGARVIIYADSSGDNKDQRERFLRFMAVAAPETNETDPEEIEWVPVSGGVILPSDTYFNVNLSEGAEQDSVIFPGERTEKECYYYQFNSEGAFVLEDGTVPADGTQTLFIIQAGKLVPGDTVPREMPKRKRDVGGLQIWSTGKTSIFRSIDQLQSADPEF